MSYILDALKKSEQQRQRSAARVTLATPPATPTPTAPSLYRNGLLAVLLVVAGLVIGWLRPWSSTPVPAVAPAAAVVPVPRPAVRVIPAATAKIEPAPPPRSVAAASPVTAAPPAPARVEPPPPATAPPATAPPATAPPAAAPRVVALTELPAAVRQELPPLAISLHVFAREPGDRIVMINNQMLREGDRVAPGLRLEQITQDGVVLDYQGHRFHRGVR